MNLSLGIGVKDWFLIPHLLSVTRKLAFSSSLMMVRKQFQVKIQMTLLNCFVVGVLLCLVHPFYSFSLHVNDFLHVCDINASFLFFVDSFRPHLKKQYHNYPERVKR